MSVRRLSARDRRALRMGAILALPVMVLELAVLPYWQARSSLAERLVSQRELLVREQALVAGEQSYTSLLAASHRSMNATAARLFTGPDDVAATATLVDYVSELARDAGVWVRQVEARSSEQIDTGLVALEMSLAAEGDMETVLDMLTLLEMGEKFVRIEDLSVERASAITPGADTLGAEVLRVSATVRGYAINGGSP